MKICIDVTDVIILVPAENAMYGVVPYIESLIILHYIKTLQVIDKGYFSEAFLFKPWGGSSPLSGLNRKPRKNPLSSL